MTLPALLTELEVEMDSSVEPSTRVILNVPHGHLSRAANVAKTALERPGGFPEDGFILYEVGQSTFVVKRNKASISVWINGGSA